MSFVLLFLPFRLDWLGIIRQGGLHTERLSLTNNASSFKQKNNVLCGIFVDHLVLVIINGCCTGSLSSSEAVFQSNALLITTKHNVCYNLFHGLAPKTTSISFPFCLCSLFAPILNLIIQCHSVPNHYAPPYSNYGVTPGLPNTAMVCWTFWCPDW